MARRPTALILQSPATSVVKGAIVLYESVWDPHIVEGHPDVDFEHIRQTLSDPCFIHEGNKADTVIFTSTNATSVDGDPLWVPVRSETENTHRVTTAYYKENGQPGKILWRRGDG